VEAKKSSNTDIRRKVVGQMLDYAANAIVYWQIDKIRDMFEATCKQQGIDPQVALDEFLNSSDDSDVFWQKAKTNLLEGKIRMLFVADEIPVELRRIVEFLNSQMDRAEVLAVEIKQFVGQNQRSLIPRVIGQTEEATAKKEIRTKKQWDWNSFSKDLESRRGPDEIDIAKKILEWTKDKLPRLWWGKGNFDGSVFPILDYNGIDYYPIAIWSYGKIEIQFKLLQRRPPFDAESKRNELLGRLNQIPGFDIPTDAIARFPKIDLSTLKNEDSLKQFLDVLDWVVQEAKNPNK
jgi:hypothetical protein